MTDRLETLPILILNPHNRCNCRCVMCDIWKKDSIEEIGARDLEWLGSDLDRLKVQWVVLSGGEPLMHSNLFQLCQMLRRRHIRITLLSTGLLLERNARRVTEHIDEVIVSLDGPPALHDRIRRLPGAFSALKRGVEALKLLKQDFVITARSTVQRLNCGALRHTVETARMLGLKSISFLAVDVTSGAFNRLSIWPAERQNQVAIGSRDLPTLEAEIEALIAQGECGTFVAESDQKLRRIVNIFARAWRVKNRSPSLQRAVGIFGRRGQRRCQAMLFSSTCRPNWCWQVTH